MRALEQSSLLPSAVHGHLFCGRAFVPKRATGINGALGLLALVEAQEVVKQAGH